MCDTHFKKGKRFLSTHFADKTNQSFTGMCTGTTLAYGIDNTLKALRQLRQRESGESIARSALLPTDIKACRK